MDRQKELTLYQVAQVLQVSYDLVHTWVEHGLLKATLNDEGVYIVKSADCINPFKKKEKDYG